MKLLQIETNIDDMTAEDLAYIQQVLLRKGAKDAWQEGIVMKKGRFGVKLCALCLPEDREQLVDVFFRESSTLGVRIFEVERIELTREVEEAEVDGQKVKIKKAFWGAGYSKIKPEYEDCVKLAQKQGHSLMEAREAVKRKKEQGEE